MAAVLLLSGVQLMILGIVGEYLGRLYLTANRKPQSVVKSVTTGEPPRRGRGEPVRRGKGSANRHESRPGSITPAWSPRSCSASPARSR